MLSALIPIAPRPDGSQMTTAARARLRITASGVLLAPARWLERARGRGRVMLVALYLLVGAVAGVFIWRAVSLNDLPDVGDPFDVEAEAAIDMPAAENAFV